MRSPSSVSVAMSSSRVFFFFTSIEHKTAEVVAPNQTLRAAVKNPRQTRDSRSTCHHREREQNLNFAIVTTWEKATPTLKDAKKSIYVFERGYIICYIQICIYLCVTRDSLECMHNLNNELIATRPSRVLVCTHIYILTQITLHALHDDINAITKN